MRKNQVEITVRRYGDEIPENAQKVMNKVKVYEFSTYTDSNDIFEALAAAYVNILNQIKEDEDFPKFGDKGIICKQYR